MVACRCPETTTIEIDMVDVSKIDPRMATKMVIQVTRVLVDFDALVTALLQFFPSISTAGE